MSRLAELICNRCGRTIVNLDRCGLNMAREYSAKYIIGEWASLAVTASRG